MINLKMAHSDEKINFVRFNNFGFVCGGFAKCICCTSKTHSVAKDAIGTTVAGSFKGYDDIQYSLNAKAGQTLSYKLTSNHDLAQINIYAPGDKPGKRDALVIGSTTGDIWKIQAARIRQLFDSDLPNAEYGTE